MKPTASLVLLTVSLVLIGPGAASAAARSAMVYVCGGGAADKDILTLRTGETFSLTDVTIANGSTMVRQIAIVQGTYPSSSAVGSQVAFLVAAGTTYAQQYKTPIDFHGPGPVTVKTICGSDNLARYVTISGDLH